MLSDSQIVAIVVGFTVGLAAIGTVVHDAVRAASLDTPRAYAYATSATIAACSHFALLILLSVNGAPMPGFAVFYVLYTLFVVLAWYLRGKAGYKIVFVIGAALYWNISLTNNTTIIAFATSLLIVYNGLTVLFIRPNVL